MKSHFTFWQLFLSQMNLGTAGGIFATGVALATWICLGLSPLIILTPVFQRDLGTLFTSGILSIFATMFLWWIAVFVAFTNVPAFLDLLTPTPPNSAIPNLAIIEFVFTRAVDRRNYFRFRALLMTLIIIGPLLFSVIYAICNSKPLEVSSTSTSKLEVYREVFAQSSSLKSLPRIQGASKDIPAKIILPRGEILFTAWLAWCGCVALVLMHAYTALIVGRVQSNQWRSGVYPAMPLIILILGFMVWTRFAPKSQTTFAESNFLFFAAHPIPLIAALLVAAVSIQLWSEARFSKMEIL